jgi:hypothetical protein
MAKNESRQIDPLDPMYVDEHQECQSAQSEVFLLLHVFNYQVVARLDETHWIESNPSLV